MMQTVSAFCSENEILYLNVWNFTLQRHKFIWKLHNVIICYFSKAWVESVHYSSENLPPMLPKVFITLLVWINTTCWAGCLFITESIPLYLHTLTQSVHRRSGSIQCILNYLTFLPCLGRTLGSICNCFVLFTKMTISYNQESNHSKEH